MKAPFTKYFFAAILTIGSAQAALVLTDHAQGANRTTFYDSLTSVATGNRPLTVAEAAQLNRFSLDVGDNDGQTFTLASTITLDSIYLAYNDQQSTGTFDLLIDVGNTGTVDHTFTVTVTDALQSGGSNSGPVHFLQFGLSSETISLDAGVHSFSVEGKADNGEGAFLIAPMFTNSDSYAGGQQISSSGRDFMFAVTAVPEPSTGLLAIFASSALLLRRRRA